MSELGGVFYIAAANAIIAVCRAIIKLQLPYKKTKAIDNYGCLCYNDFVKHRMICSK